MGICGQPDPEGSVLCVDVPALSRLYSFFLLRKPNAEFDFLASQIELYQRKDTERQAGGIAQNLPGRCVACPKLHPAI